MPPLTLPHSLWETVKCDFKSLFPEDVFQMWFEPVVCLETTEDAITLGVPNDFAAIWIHDNYLDLISQRLRLTAGRPVVVNLRKIDAPRPAPLAGGAGAPRAAADAGAHGRARGAGLKRTGRGDDRGPVVGALNSR